MTPYYKDRYITIYNASCENVLPLLGTFDLLLTDPPYGIGFAAQPTTGRRRARLGPEAWDDHRPEHDVIETARNLCAAQVIWGGNYFQLPTSRGWLSWFKPDAPPSMGNFELAWTNRDAPTRQISCSIGETNPERLGHPTQKPLRVMHWCLAQFPSSQTILDPFAGTGTTGRAAKDLCKLAVLIEREERYCEIAAKRMLQEVLPLS